jgi:hypothetical protein
LQGIELVEVDRVTEDRVRGRWALHTCGTRYDSNQPRWEAIYDTICCGANCYRERECSCVWCSKRTTRQMAGEDDQGEQQERQEEQQQEQQQEQGCVHFMQVASPPPSQATNKCINAYTLKAYTRKLYAAHCRHPPRTRHAHATHTPRTRHAHATHTYAMHHACDAHRSIVGRRHSVD